MELLVVSSILASVLAVSAFCLSVYGVIIIKSMERSTHTVTWQTASPSELEETAKLNEKFNKEQSQEAELQDLGF